MIKLITFTKNDEKEMSSIMERAFNEDSQIHLHRNGGPTGYDNGEFVKKWFYHPKATPFSIYSDDVLIGGIIIWINNVTNENFLGCFFIDPRYENFGIGLEVWQMIEEMYPDTIIWRTETPGFSHRNHHFYINKCGFHCVKIVDPKDPENSMFNLSKQMILLC